MDAAEGAQDGPLDAESLARFRAEGWLALGRILDEETVRTLRAEERRFRLPRAYGGEANPTLFVNVQLCHRSEAIRRVCTTGPHVAMLRQLLGPAVCLTHQQFIVKRPDAEGSRSDVPWHQDDGYGRLEPPDDVTIFVALVDTDERNGGLSIVPGSHRAGLLPHGPAGVNPLLVETELPAEPVAVSLRAGEAVAFTGLTVHGSGPNRSGAERAALFMRYCDPRVRMATEGDRPVLEDPHSWMVAGEAP
ncbi:MAG: phytanoyl-CoA dioxygenase family protein [Myxococcota bacterium]|nr:phytanoyl-CoA dioxygenase family protein [Myxococcota bacterium]